VAEHAAHDINLPRVATEIKEASRQGHRWPAWLRSPNRELCTEAEHEPVDSLVHEILVASTAATHCSFMTEATRLGQGERSGVFLKKNDRESKWMNLFKCFSDSVDIIRGHARNRHADGSNEFDINPFSPICTATAGFGP
jgi:hypothetical protein